MSIANIITAVTDALLGALTSFVTAIPGAIKSAFEALFFDGTGSSQTVSAFASVLLIFGGITLAMGITKWVTHLVRKKVG